MTEFFRVGDLITPIHDRIDSSHHFLVGVVGIVVDIEADDDDIADNVVYRLEFPSTGDKRSWYGWRLERYYGISKENQDALEAVIKDLTHASSL